MVQRDPTKRSRRPPNRSEHRSIGASPSIDRLPSFFFFRPSVCTQNRPAYDKISGAGHTSRSKCRRSHGRRHIRCARCSRCEVQQALVGWWVVVDGRRRSVRPRMHAAGLPVPQHVRRGAHRRPTELTAGAAPCLSLPPPTYGEAGPGRPPHIAAVRALRPTGRRCREIRPRHRLLRCWLGVGRRVTGRPIEGMRGGTDRPTDRERAPLAGRRLARPCVCLWLALSGLGVCRAGPRKAARSACAARARAPLRPHRPRPCFFFF